MGQRTLRKRQGFKTDDSGLLDYKGQPFDVLRPVDPATYDFEEVGPMHEVRFTDGFVIEAFQDETHEEV